MSEDPGSAMRNRSRSRPSASAQYGHDPSASGRFDPTADLGAGAEAPPAYGEALDHLQLSQAGFQAGATVTDDGRVDININQTSRKFIDLLAPTLRSQLFPLEKQPAEQSLPPAYIPSSLAGQEGVPPPKLNVVIQIVGSRGDVQPFVALGKVLKETYGHRVRLATHPTFQTFVEENGLEFFSIGGDPAELMAFMVKNPGLMPGIDTLKSGEITKRRRGIEEIVQGCWRSCIEPGNGLGPPPPPRGPDERRDERPESRPFVADAIIANPPSFAHIHIAEKMGIPLHMMFTMPWSPTRVFPHPLANIKSSNTDVVMTNYVSYALVEMLTWQGLRDVLNRFRTNILGLEPLSLIAAPGILTRLHISTTYCWSPALIPKPHDWGREVTVAGFYFLNLASSYTPDPELAAFLEAGPPPVYIGFGSIVVDDPDRLTKMIFDAVSMTGVRVLVSKGWGGLGADSVGIPDGVYMLGNVPHDWLFKRVSCVVHHGGAGTTAAGISTGKPTVVVPFFGDQPFWGAMLAKAGAGPEPIPYKQLTAENLAAAIQEALRPETQQRAKELGEKIREETGTETGGRSFHASLEMDKLRCSLAPSRVAVWRVRKSQVRLSALAASVLVKDGVIQYEDLKLYRPNEYYTEDQPYDPISAVTVSLVGDITDIGMAVADFPREMFKGKKKKEKSIPGTPVPEAASAAEAASATSEGTRAQSPREGLSQTPSAASLNAPSVTVSGPGTPIVSGVEGSEPSTAVPPPKRSLSPSQDKRSRSSSSRRSGGSHTSEPGFTFDTAVNAGVGVSRIVGTGMQTPMNFCLGLARGFRNAPKLYNDDTVRPQEKVTGLASGLRIASREFGFGLYDGISGMVTQPLKGAEKEGGIGLLKGVGKGIGGLVLKPAAAFWSIPAYTMQGLHVSVRDLYSKSLQNYIPTSASRQGQLVLASRMHQGELDLAASTAEEREDILVRWHAKGASLRDFNSLKKEETAELRRAAAASTSAATPGPSRAGGLGDQPPKTGWFHTRHLPIDERRRLHEQKAEWQRRQTATPAGPPQGPWAAPEEEELERAIRASIAETSRGDPAEDARVEAQIRASVQEMRRISEAHGGGGGGGQQQPQQGHAGGGAAGLAAGPGDELSDEEYQALVEEAVQQSLAAAAAAPAGGDDKELLRAIEASRLSEQQQQQQRGQAAGDDGDEDEAMLRRAMEESARAHREAESRRERARTEEEAMLEHARQQSLAEAAYPQQRSPGLAGGAGKGKGAAGAGGEEEEEDDDDDDLRRALEESLRTAGGGSGGGAARGAGPSSPS